MAALIDLQKMIAADEQAARRHVPREPVTSVAFEALGRVIPPDLRCETV